MSGISSIPGSRVIRIKGVPPKATAADVVEFFHDIEISEHCVHLHFRERRGAGEALVVLSNDADVARALEKDKEILSPKFGQRYVRVMSADDLSPEELVRINGMVGPQVRASMPSSMSTHSAGAGSGVVKVDGLPQAITASELLQLFWGIRVLPAATVLHRPVDQPGNTHAYLDFGSAASAAHVIANWNGTVMTTSAGVFTLSVKASTKAELERAQGECGGENAVVKVRGLPIRATIQDLAAFFSGYMVKKNGIHLQPVGDNRHSKVAYVEFETVEEATRSLEKDHQLLGAAFGDRYCILQRVTRKQMDADLARFATGDGTSSARTAGGTGATSSTGMDYTSSGSRHPGFRPVAMPPGFMLPGVYGAQPPARMAPPMMMSPWGMPYGMHGALHGYPPMMMPPIPPPPLGVHPASARYMVQDLTTGQQVFLDPRFNVYPGQGPPMGGSAGQFMGSAGPSGTGATGTEPSYSTLHDSLSDGEDHTVPNPHLEGTSRPYGTGSRASGQTTEPAPGGDAPGEDQGAEEQGERVSDGGGTGEGKDGSGEGSNEGSDRASGRGSGDGAGRECGEQGGANVVGKASAGPEPAPGTEAPASDAGPAKATCGGSSAMRSPREAPPAHKRVSLDVEDLVVDKRPSKHLHKECP